MSEENKTVLLKITLDTADLKKNSEIASKKIEELKIKQAILRGESKQGTVEYAKLSAEIKAQNLILNQSAKALEINTRLGDKNNLSLKEQGELLSAGKIALRNLTTDQIQNTDSGKKLNQQVLDLNESLKKSEAGYGVHVREVGNYDKGIKGLKAELKDLKSQMVGLDAGSIEYQQASEKAGVLGDKIKEVNENVKASSGGTGFEKLSNNLSLVQDDLMNMDFAGVSEKMKQMAVVSKSMTFKETLGGLKNMASGLASLGKAILANPLFLMVGVIVGIVGALKLWSDSVNEKAVRAQDNHTASIQRNIDKMIYQNEKRKEIAELELKLLELDGANAKKIGDKKLKEYEREQNDRLALLNKYAQKDKDLRTNYELTDSGDRRKELADKIKDNRQNFDELEKTFNGWREKRKIIEKEISKDIEDENKSHNEKIKAENEKAVKDKIDLANRIKDLILDNEDQTNENQRKIIENRYKFLEDSANGNVEELILIEERKNAELEALDVAIYEDQKARIEENYKRQQLDAKGNSKILNELKKQNNLDLQALDIDFNNAQKTRESEHKKTVEDNAKLKFETSRKTTQEIAILEKELALSNSKGSKDEFSKWSDLQFEKVRQIEENAQHEIELNKLVGDEKTKVELEAQLAVENIKKESFAKKEKDTEKEVEATRQEKQQISTVSLNSANQLSTALFQIEQNRIAGLINETENKNTTESDLLQKQLDSNLITQAEYDDKKSKADVAYQAKVSKLKKDAFEKQKLASIIQATINTAVGITEAIPNIPLMALAGALGAVNIGLIASQPTPKFAKGGVFGGNSHASGGNKGYFEDGTQIEVEKDEAFFILNKRATPYINQLSNLNTATGGIPLMANGGSVSSSGIIASNISSQVDNQLTNQNQLIRLIQLMPQPVVAVQDINYAQGRQVRVENRANF